MPYLNESFCKREAVTFCIYLGFQIVHAFLAISEILELDVQVLEGMGDMRRAEEVLGNVQRANCIPHSHHSHHCKNSEKKYLCLEIPYRW